MPESNLGFAVLQMQRNCMFLMMNSRESSVLAKSHGFGKKPLTIMPLVKVG